MIFFVLTPRIDIIELFSRDWAKEIEEFDIISVVSNTEFNVLAWAADSMAEWNGILPDMYYVRPEKKVPEDSLWKMIFGDIYTIYWSQLIWTYEPFDAYIRYNIAATEVFLQSGDSYVKAFQQKFYGFVPHCTDVFVNMNKKLIKLVLNIPAWLVVVVLALFRVIVLLVFAILLIPVLLIDLFI